MRMAIRALSAMALVGAGVLAPTAASGSVQATSRAPAVSKPAATDTVHTDTGAIGTTGTKTDFRVLVFTKTAGERRSSIKAGVEAIRDIGRRNNFSVEASDDAGRFTDATLKRYRAVVFLNTTGDVLNDAQQAAFERYFTDGGGYLGIRAAAETEPDWAFYQAMLGTKATGTSTVQQATVKVADRVHPASKVLPEYWKPTDAFYNFAGNVRGVSHVLATVDEGSYTGGAMGPDHPIIWCKDYKGGRSFYTGLGETSAEFQSTSFRKHLGGAIEWTAGRGNGDCGATVLANYQQTVIAAPPNIGEPIEFDVLPDGRVIQTTRPGEVRLHDPKSGTTSVIATIPVYTHDEDGLYGGAIDPGFATNHWVYLYYSPPLSTPTTNAPTSSTDPNAWDVYKGYNQLSRFKFVETPTPHLDMASEQQILRVNTDRGACCHVAGETRFDSHGNLLMVTGDDTPAGGGNSGGFSPMNGDLTVPPTASCPDPCYNAPYVDARRSAGNTNDLRGKLLRIHVQADGSYTIPKGNLFRPGTPQTRPEIYAMGFRNPFRLNLDPNDVAYVTDYSPDSRTPQVFRGPPGTGRLEIVRHAANYGWPYCVAPNLPYYRWNFATSTPLDNPPQPFECGNPVHGPENASRHNTGQSVTPALTRPDVWYSYNDNNPPTPLGTPCPAYYTQDPPGTCPQLFPEFGPGGGVGPHGAAPYHFDPKNPNPTKFPAYYDKAIFFGEFTRDYLREIRLDSHGKVFKINDLLTCGDVSADRNVKPFICDAPMDMRWGPDGNFYLLSYGDGFFRANTDALLVKFSYVKGTRAPTAKLSATPTNGQAPLAVTFSSDGSTDPDPGESIKFAWDFDNNGTTDSTDPNPTFTYTANGVYTAKLTVTDSSGKTATASTTIEVGNTAPTVKITAPADGGFFNWGDPIPWSVTVTDPEDGTIDCSKVTMSFALGHDNHGHGEGSQTGCSGVYQTDPADATHAGGYLYGGFTASYTDQGANNQPPLTTIEQRVIQQKRQQVEYVVDQSGTSTALTTDPDGGDSNRNGIDPGDWVAINRVVNFQNMNSVTFRVSGGSADTAGAPRAAVQLRLDAPNGPVVTTATINATTGNNDYASQTFPITDPGGTHRLYLVFQSVSGGPATNLLNLNWAEFGGQGVAGASGSGI
ncbi:MAG TPA: ThuA domain-containing protein [Streptosporangiaceae bacterium]